MFRSLLIKDTLFIFHYLFKMVQCSAFGCKSRSKTNEEGITFHRFPLKYPERNNIWIENMKLGNFEANKNHRLCSKHFEAHCFYKAGQKTGLLDDAVPTIFTELPEHLQPSRITSMIPMEEIKVEITDEPLAQHHALFAIDMEQPEHLHPSRVTDSISIEEIKVETLPSDEPLAQHHAVPATDMELHEHSYSRRGTKRISIEEIKVKLEPSSEPLAQDSSVPTIDMELPGHLQPGRIRNSISIEEIKEESVPSYEPLSSTPDVTTDTPRTKKLRRHLLSIVLKNKKKLVKIKRLNEEVSRYKNKILALKDKVKNLRARNLISNKNVLLTQNINSKIVC